METGATLLSIPFIPCKENRMTESKGTTTLSKTAAQLGKAIDQAVNGGAILAGCVLLFIAAITAYEVIVRYIFNAPTEWTLDLSIYLLLWFSYASVASLQKANRHVKVDLVISHFPPRTRAIWDIATNTIFLFFGVLLVYYSLEFTLSSYHDNEYGWSMLRILLWPVKASMPFGGLLLVLFLSKDIIVRLQSLPVRPPRGGETGLYDRPAILLAIFIALIAFSTYTFTIHGGLGLLFLMLTLLFGGVPIFPALGMVGIVGYFLVFGGESAVAASFPNTAYTSLENFALVCLPLFVFVGQAISSSGVSDELYNAATKWVGHLPGGEGIATVLACAIFAAVSISSVATATTIGLIAIPALAARKYNRSFSLGLLAAGGTLGIMIPPSGTMIIYSAVTEESLGKLFLAGVFPGILLALVFISYVVYFCLRNRDYDRLERASWKERIQATKAASWGLLAPVIILGGIYSGVFTPLESGGVAAIYVMVMVLVRRKVSLRDLLKMVSDSTFASIMVLSIIVGAMVMGDYMTLTKIPDLAVELVNSYNLSPWGVLATLMVLYLVMGMFLEVVSIMLITLPIVYPLIIKLGFDGIWFAVIITLNMEMACITPPVGLNLYAIQGISRAPLIHVIKGVSPFFFIMLIWMVFLCLFPSLSTWLPSTLVSR